MTAQLELRLRISPAEQLRIAKARCFLCEHFHASVLPEVCIRRQLDDEHAPDGYCKSRKCQQGRRILIHDGLLESAPCECCGGSGKVVRLAARASKSGA